MQRVHVALSAADPLSLAGLTSQLESQPEITLVDDDQRSQAEVAVVVTDRLTADVLSRLRRAAAEFGTPVVLIIQDITEAELLTAVECKVVAVVPRARATGDRLLHSVLAAASGGGVMPPNLVGELVKHVERLRREGTTRYGLNASGLTPRETDVLRMMAEGMDTSEIAEKLCYSERTIKNIISGVTQRLNLRNRAHAVAFAVRSGMI